jgi:hypothetical protein
VCGKLGGGNPGGPYLIVPGEGALAKIAKTAKTKAFGLVLAFNGLVGWGVMDT